jgi:signal transduction histidine kinase
LAISAPIAVISVPLVEVDSTSGESLGWLVASAIAQVPAVLVLYLAWLLLYRKAEQHWSLLLIIGALSGLTKGVFTHGVSLWLELDTTNTPTLGSRVVTAVLTWGVAIAGFAIINYKVLAPRQLWQDLQFELRRSGKRLVDNEQQLQWLVQRRLSGLSDTLARDLTALINRAKQKQSSEADSYGEVSELLRSYAKSELRETSRDLWSHNPTRSPLVVASLRSLTENPLNAKTTALLIGFGYGINEIRLSGVSLALLGTAILTAISYLTTALLAQLANREPKTRPAAPWVFSLATAVSMYAVLVTLPVPRTDEYVIATTALSALWGFASIFLAGWMKIADELFSSELEDLTKRSAGVSEKLRWLETHVEAVNRELAKYLHGVVQSRLMAYAMQIENQAKSGNRKGVESSIEELRLIFEKPLSTFQFQSLDLDAELSSIAAGWQGVVEVSFDTEEASHNPSATLSTAQLVTEGVANAFKHGQATKVSVTIKDRSDTRTIEISDNGHSLGDSKPGLGMTIISSITQGNYSLRREGSQTKLDCQLALSPRQ